MKIIKDKKLLIPLYHGTSTLFLDSINNYGFGGRNLIKEINAMDMLTKLYERCISETDFKKKEPVSDIVCRKVLSRDSDWHYDSIYLTTSKCAAINHANFYKYGSEVLSVAMYVYEYMLKNNIHYQFENELHKELVAYLQKAKINPVVFEFTNINIDTLKIEGKNREGLLFSLFKLQKAYDKFGEKAGDLLQITFTIPYGSQLKEENIIIHKDLEVLNEL